MICTLGVWGYLEQYHPNEGWKIARNGDEASIGELFRFIAQLDESAMIPWTELHPDNVTCSSISTHAHSSASESKENSPSVEYLDIRYLDNGTSGLRPENFQEAVWSRDGTRCVLTSSAAYQCEAARLVNKFNTIEVMDEIIHPRKELGGEELGYWYDVGGPDDVRVGIFLQAALQRNLEASHISYGAVQYRVPNFGMKSLNQPADDLGNSTHFRGGCVHLITFEIMSPERSQHQHGPPVSLTAETLCQMNNGQLAPRDWVGTNSSVYLVPFDASAHAPTLMRVPDDADIDTDAELPAFGPHTEIRKPKDKDLKSQWPPNLIGLGEVVFSPNSDPTKPSNMPGGRRLVSLSTH